VLFVQNSRTAVQDTDISCVHSGIQIYSKKGKVIPYSLTIVGPGADPGGQAVSRCTVYSKSKKRAKFGEVFFRQGAIFIIFDIHNQHEMENGVLVGSLSKSSSQSQRPQLGREIP